MFTPGGAHSRPSTIGVCHTASLVLGSDAAHCRLRRGSACHPANELPNCEGLVMIADHELTAVMRAALRLPVDERRRSRARGRARQVRGDLPASGAEEAHEGPSDASPCPKQRASTARTAPQSTCLFAPRRDRHQTTRLNVAGVARRFRAAKASSFLSILIGSRTDPSQGGASRVRAASVGGLVIHAMPRRSLPAAVTPSTRPASSSRGVRCHPAVMRGQLQFELARSCRGSLLMPTRPHPPAFFRCPSCKALYQVVKAEAGPVTVDLGVACSVCRGPLVAREGQFVLKYFLLRKAIPAKGPTARRAKPR